MLTLAIETSCDDTSIALVRDTWTSFVVEKMRSFSQVTSHNQYGGVVPEIASREHAQQILHVLFHMIMDTETDEQVEQFTHALKNESDSILRSLPQDRVEDFFWRIDSIAVTVTPGLPWSLAVGRSIAHYLSLQFDKPLVDVHHIHGHIFSLLLERNRNEISFPMMVLTASGGHNELYLVAQDTPLNEAQQSVSQDVGPYTITPIGKTLDDAAGEAFDKVSRMLGGPYPGGKRISEQALHGKANPDIQFTRIYLKATEFNFSFSWMKSQVHRLLEKWQKKGKQLTKQDIADISYEFQESVVEVLAKKLVKSWIFYWCKTIAIAWGVSCNARLREYVAQYVESRQWTRAKDQTWKLVSHVPVFLGAPTQITYCIDNAAMIGVVWHLTS